VIYVVGESCPLPGGQPLRAVKPGDSGHRLAAMAGCSPDELPRLFRLRNLSPHPYSAKAARRTAARITRALKPGDVVVMLGAMVAKAFGAGFVWPLFPFFVGRGLGWRLHHPSGMCRALNDKNERSLMTAILMSLAASARREVVR
jgi:hypothetical protein